MKHLKNFSLFESSLKNQGATSSEMVFDWMPYDSEVENPIQSSIPQELKLDEVVPFLEENSSMIPEISKAGLFIAHVPSKSGFDRFIITSLDPLLLDMSQFDKQFNMVQEYKGIKPEELDLGQLVKGSKVIRRFGL